MFVGTVACFAFREWKKMVMGELAEGTEVAIIGGGPAGYVCAIRAAQLGKQVTVIEREGLGGLCLFHGCIPSKALIHASNQVRSIKEMEQMGISAALNSVNAPKLQEWKAGVITRLNNGVKLLFSKLGIQTIVGTAFFQAPKRLGIVAEHGMGAMEFEECVIATGSTPRSLPGLEFNSKTIISSREVLSLQEIPSRMGVVGGGYIGVELGTAYAKLGSKVTVIEKGGKILPSIEESASEIVFKRMQELGIDFCLNSSQESVVQQDGRIRITISSPDKGRQELEFDKVLVAVGHKPSTEGLKLENVGVQLTEQGFVKVDSKRRTTAPGIYAIGDVAGHPMLAHKASREGKVVAEIIAGKDVEYDNKVVPAVIFSDPEVASVGLQEGEAQRQGVEVMVGVFNMRGLGRSLTVNRPHGFVKLIADAHTQAVLGALVVGEQASDLIAEIALAIESGLLLEDIAYTIHSHPTFAEAIEEAAEAALGKAIHVPKK